MKAWKQLKGRVAGSKCVDVEVVETDRSIGGRDKKKFNEARLKAVKKKSWIKSRRKNQQENKVKKTKTLKSCIRSIADFCAPSVVWGVAAFGANRLFAGKFGQE